MSFWLFSDWYFELVSNHKGLTEVSKEIETGIADLGSVEDNLRFLLADRASVMFGWNQTSDIESTLVSLGDDTQMLLQQVNDIHQSIYQWGHNQQQVLATMGDSLKG